eukprot:2039855-Alexandrium_andersonii.AAC.1
MCIRDRGWAQPAARRPLRSATTWPPPGAGSVGGDADAPDAKPMGGGGLDGGDEARCPAAEMHPARDPAPPAPAPPSPATLADGGAS